MRIFFITAGASTVHLVDQVPPLVREILLFSVGVAAYFLRCDDVLDMVDMVMFTTTSSAARLSEHLERTAISMGLGHLVTAGLGAIGLDAIDSIKTAVF
jgi:hypothetical protein